MAAGTEWPSWNEKGRGVTATLEKVEGWGRGGDHRQAMGRMVWLWLSWKKLEQVLRETEEVHVCVSSWAQLQRAASCLGDEEGLISFLTCALDCYDSVPANNILYNSLREGWVTRRGTEMYTRKLWSSLHTFLQPQNPAGERSRAGEGHCLLQKVKA